MTIEHRAFVEPIEFRSDGGTKITATGVAMRYGAKSKPIDGKFREQFHPGSFTKTIGEQDVRSHNEHAGPYLGRTSNGTLRLIDTRSELGYELDLPDTTAGRDAAALLERGDIRGSSIGFNAVRAAEKYTVDTDGMALRSIGEAKLFRVDFTVAPYYDASTAELALRSLADEHHLELRSLLDLGAAELSTLIATTPVDEEQEAEERSSDEGRETPTFERERIAHLLF